MTRALCLTLLVGCTGGAPAGDGPGDLLGDDVRGWPDPTLSSPPVCVEGENCLALDVPNQPWRVWPDDDGGAWMAFYIEDYTFDDVSPFRLGGFELPSTENPLYGDTFIAHLDATGTWDALENLGDEQPIDGDVAPDGSLAIAQTLYPSSAVGDGSAVCLNYQACSWFGVRNPDGTLRWSHLTNTPDPQLFNVIWGPEGDVWITTLAGATLDGMELEGDGPLYVVRLDGDTGEVVWSRTIGVGLANGLFVDDDGAVFVLVEGSYALGAGRLLDVDIPYPHSAMARVDGADDWVTPMVVQNPWIVSTFAARDPDGGFVLGYWWSGAQFGTTNGSLTLGPFGPFPMDTWQDGAMGKMSRDGEWVWGRPTARQSIGNVVVGDDGTPFATTEEFYWTDSDGGAVKRRFCEWLPGGAARACRPAYYAVLEGAPDGALWWVEVTTGQSEARIVRIER